MAPTVPPPDGQRWTDGPGNPGRTSPPVRAGRRGPALIHQVKTEWFTLADRFAAETPLVSEQIRLDRLTGQLKLELQYVLQRRYDDRQGKLTPDVVMRVVRTLAAAGLGSLLHHDEDTCHDWARSTITDTRSRGFLSYASRLIADLAEAGGWDTCE